MDSFVCVESSDLSLRPKHFQMFAKTCLCGVWNSVHSVHGHSGGTPLESGDISWILMDSYESYGSVGREHVDNGNSSMDWPSQVHWGCVLRKQGEGRSLNHTSKIRPSSSFCNWTSGDCQISMFESGKKWIFTRSRHELVSSQHWQSPLKLSWRAEES